MLLLRRLLSLSVAVTAVLPASMPVLPAAAQRPAVADRALVGTYDGGAVEIAAGLELRADGRFHYVLSYGALDEEAEGRWSAEGGAVLLTSDPVTPPRFVLVEEKGRPDGRLLVKLDLPAGMSGQYFRAEMRRADGTTVDRQLTEEGELPPIAPGAQTASVTLLLPIADLSSGAVHLSGKSGHQLLFRFEPHDLGKVAFARTTLRIDGGELVLHQHDRMIRFRRLHPSGPAG